MNLDEDAELSRQSIGELARRRFGRTDQERRSMRTQWCDVDTVRYENRREGPRGLPQAQGIRGTARNHQPRVIRDAGRSLGPNCLISATIARTTPTASGIASGKERKTLNTTTSATRPTPVATIA